MYKKIILNPKTPFSEMFTADQLFGQFVWALSELYGESHATEFVDRSIAAPLIKFSALFIDGYLPKPVYLTGNSGNDISNEIRKHNKKCKWLSYDMFSKIQENEHIFDNQKLPIAEVVKVESIQETHVTLSRDSFTSKNLFNPVFIRTSSPLSFYVEIVDPSLLKELEDVISYWAFVGLGGDRNIGKGQFDFTIVDLSEVENKIFSVKDTGYFISLSNCFGCDLKPIEWALEVYSGISGKGNITEGRYRKKPIIQYKVGSLFSDNGKGVIATNMGASEKICSYGYTFPIYVKR